MNYSEVEMTGDSTSIENEILSPAEEIARLTQENRALTVRNQTLERLARLDELTGLGNLRSFREEMYRSVAGAFRSGRPVSLIFTDIDNFKLVNDLYDHKGGDDILIQVAASLKHGTRTTDRAFRYGGEELVIILPDTTLDDAVGVAERLRKKIETSTIVTTSLGVSSFQTDPVDGKIPDEEIQDKIHRMTSDADTAMYAAKAAGRNGVGLVKDNQILILGRIEPTASKMTVKQQTSLEHV